MLQDNHINNSQWPINKLFVITLTQFHFFLNYRNDSFVSERTPSIEGFDNVGRFNITRGVAMA